MEKKELKMQKTQELIDKYPNTFKKLGGIIYNLNQIEVFIILALSTIFIDHKNPTSETNFIFNDSLADENVFPTFENKRRMLFKTIEYIDRAAKENNIKFDSSDWLNLLKSIKRLQEIRNKLSHHQLNFPGNNDKEVGYYVRKSNKERLEDKKSGSMKLIKFDLDDEFAISENLVQKASDLILFSVNTVNILIKINEKSKP